MPLSTPKHPFTLHAVLAVAGLLASLCVGACSRSTHLTESLVAPTRDGSLALGAGGAGKGHHQPPPPSPTLLSPANGATGVDPQATLSWTTSSSANNYRLQVATDAGFSSMVVDQQGFTAGSADSLGLAGNTQYFWRVSAKNAGGPSPFSAPWSFSTGAAAPPPPPPPPPPAPAAPTLSSPADGAVDVAVNPTLGWNASTGADSYRVQVSTSSTFGTTVVDQSGIAATSDAISGLAAGTQYFWRVNATNAGGTSAFSTAFSFTTAAAAPPPPPPPAAPAPPTLSSPANGTTGVAVNPTLSWNASTGADSYRVQVSTSSTFGTTVVNQAGITATSDAITGLTAGTQYFWRVNATNAGGTSAFSTVFHFTTAAAPPPPSTDPCASLRGLGGPVVAVTATVPQFRVARLRIEVSGDVTAGTINTLGPCTASASPAVQVISGTGTVTLSGGGSVTANGGTLTFGPLTVPVPAEPGVVLATNATGDVLEIIWPALAGLPAGPPIIRLQLASFSAAVQSGVSVDATMTFTAQAPDGTTATFTASGSNMIVP
ncbi:MAG TPA: fibronectin type III domain-containing protein [Candidatus Eisenbacteria bacterium]|jgi:hypothetical protein